jgi:hypothetical protein
MLLKKKKVFLACKGLMDSTSVWKVDFWNLKKEEEEEAMAILIKIRRIFMNPLKKKKKKKKRLEIETKIIIICLFLKIFYLRGVVENWYPFDQELAITITNVLMCFPLVPFKAFFIHGSIFWYPIGLKELHQSILKV